MNGSRIAILLCLTGCGGCSSRNADLIRAIDRDDPQAVRVALRGRPDLDPACGPNSICKPLALAAEHANLEIVRLLLDAHADPNGRNAYQDTAFMTAQNATALFSKSESDVRAVQKYLLDHGADPNQENAFGASALTGAVAGGDIELMEACLAHGAVIDKVDKSGWTPLFAAAEFGQPGAADWLLRHGARPEHRDTSGKTAAQEAIEQGHPEVAAVIEKLGQRR